MLKKIEPIPGLSRRLVYDLDWCAGDKVPGERRRELSLNDREAKAILRLLRSGPGTRTQMTGSKGLRPTVRRTRKGKRYYAARFYKHTGPKSPYSIAVYDTDVDPEEFPQDWIMWFERKDWRQMGAKMPPRKGHIEVWLRVERND